MVKKISFNLLLAGMGIFCGLKASAQTNRYMVFFTDKDTAAYETADPLTYLSRRSLDRRQDQNIQLTPRDFTVKENYLDSVRAGGMQVFATSRWLNACLASGNIDQVEMLQAAPYISHIDYVAPQNVPENARVADIGRKSKRNNRGQNDEVTAYQNSLLGIDIMHEDGYKGEGMLIAVVDGGFAGVNTAAPFSHLFSEEKVIKAYNFVNYSDNIYGFTDHGSEALSCMAALSEGVYTGGSPDAHYMLLVSEDVSSEYRIEEYNWILAAEMADSAGADIISTSLGYNYFNDPTMDYSLTDMDGETAVISVGSNIAAETGMLLISSAGNEGDNPNWRTIVPPADAPSVLAVGSFFGKTFDRAGFSSMGPTTDGRIKPDVVATGSPAYTVNQFGNATQAYGTSFAAPIVTGLAAGFWQANPSLTASEVKERLIRSGNSYLAPDSLIGHGAPNYQRAQENIVLSDGLDLPEEDIIPYPYPNPLSGGMLHVPLTGFNDHELQGSLISNDGRLMVKFDVQNDGKEAEEQIQMGNLPAGIYLLTLTGKSLTRRYRIVKY
ncbi:S8 family peptidase [Roseivirga sp. BDSF3-8]|uniref:S8 family peptidase n=1 Tax=Roseivirga sp. BDSF3-8 TaxID=3241598 RepID=UPI003531C792